jgi:short-subunit dehydrogenase
MPYAIVTGASQGIGKAIAEKLLSGGFSVAICARSQKKLEVVASEWRSKFGDSQILAVAADLGTIEGVNDFAIEVLSAFPHIDLLVNNAGTFQPGVLADEAEGQLEKMIEVNLYSAYRLTRKLLPVMKRKGGGHIFNMCSVASLKAYPNGGSYSISKYALLGFTENLREELRPDNIKVTAICPGATWSPSWEGSGVEQERIMEANDIADMLWATYSLSSRAVTETIIMRPVKGDL